MKKFLTFSILILINIIFVINIYNQGLLNFNYSNSLNFPIRGVDVSSYQGNIDWKVLSKKISFAYIKATEGSKFVDPYFHQNWQNANDTKIQIGAYHFFSFESDGKSQADNFIRNVPKEEFMLPPAIDLEFYGKYYLYPPDILTIKSNLKQLIEVLNQYYGLKPIIYVTYESFELYIKNDFIENKIWIRDILRQPNLSDGRNWYIWQYSSKGIMEGFDGEEKFIDLNVIRENNLTANS